MKYFHDVYQKECRLWSEKSGITWRVKLGKPKANTMWSLVQTHLGVCVATFGYVNLMRREKVANMLKTLISNKLNSLLLKTIVVVSTFAATAAFALADLPGGPGVNQLNLTTGVTKISQEQSWLHWYMLIICTVVFILVFGVMFYSILKHRKSVGHKPANFHESVTVEVIWTIIPFIIVILMALPATKVVVAMKDTTNADLTVKATGMQWKWGYSYVNGEGEGIGFVSTLDTTHREMSESGGPKSGQTVDNYLLKVDSPLVVPVNKKIRVITTANDEFMLLPFQPSVSCKMPYRDLCVIHGSVRKKLAITMVNVRSCVVKSILTCLFT